MRVLVTGGAGFIGSHLCEFFLGKGWDVVCMDDFVTGSRDNLAGGRVAARFHPHRARRHRVHPASTGPLDWVLHFASPASPHDYLELPIQTLKVGALGTHNALGVAKAKGARFLLASTSEVYGDPLVHPQREDYWGHVNPVGPRGVYDEAKRFAEAITMAYHRTHRIDTRIVRIFNTFGPRMRLDDGRAIPAFLTRRSPGPRSPSSATARRRARSSTSPTSSMGSGADADAGQRPREHRQPARDDPAGARQAHHQSHGLAQRDRVRSAADRRPQGPPARHRPRARRARLGTARRHRRRVCA